MKTERVFHSKQRKLLTIKTKIQYRTKVKRISKIFRDSHKQHLVPTIKQVMQTTRNNKINIKIRNGSMEK